MGAERFTASILLDVIAMTLAAFYMAILIAGELQKKDSQTAAPVAKKKILPLTPAFDKAA